MKCGIIKNWYFSRILYFKLSIFNSTINWQKGAIDEEEEGVKKQIWGKMTHIESAENRIDYFGLEK